MPLKLSLTFETTEKTQPPQPTVVYQSAPVATVIQPPSPPQDWATRKPRKVTLPKIEAGHLMTAGCLILAVATLSPTVNGAIEGFIYPSSSPTQEEPAPKKFIRPVDAPVSSPFGYRFHPIDDDWKLHKGTDYAAPSGAPIVAIADGTVTRAEFLSGYGLSVEINHGGGTTSFYAHCSELLVTPGQQVEQGMVIGKVGSTGGSTGPHLHLELERDGQLVDPEKFLPP